VCKRGNGWPGKGVGRGGEVRPRGVEFGGRGGGRWSSSVKGAGKG
jgi:hypothetical protein